MAAEKTPCFCGAQPWQHLPVGDADGHLIVAGHFDVHEELVTRERGGGCLNGPSVVLVSVQHGDRQHAELLLQVFDRHPCDSPGL